MSVPDSDDAGFEPLTRLDASDLILSILAGFPAAERLPLHDEIGCAGHDDCPWWDGDVQLDAVHVHPDHECCRCPWWHRIEQALEGR